MVPDGKMEGKASGKGCRLAVRLKRAEGQMSGWLGTQRWEASTALT